MKNLLKIIVIKIYSKLIILNLWFLNSEKNVRYFYNHSLGFGDSFDYYLNNYYTICKNKKNLPLSFGSFHEEIINFFFKNYKKIFFKISKFMPYYGIISEVKKSKYFNPKISYNLDKNYLMKDEFLGRKNLYSKQIIIKKLNEHKISKSIKNLCNKKYVCLFVKFYNNNINDISNIAVIRQTTNFKKICQIIDFLKVKKIFTIIIGNKLDKGTVILKNKIKEADFLLDYKINFYDQIYVANNSLGYIGNSGGILYPYFYLGKKILCFDTFEIPTSKVSKNFKNFFNLYKKIIINNSIKRLSHKHLNLSKEIKYQIKENNFSEIKSAINNFLLK
jgi:putative transposon-encoded protein